jgi:predicted dehydrogenase
METINSHRKLKMGMIGGGPDSFVGNIHRIAANMDGLIELVCGVFSSSYEKSQKLGKELNLDPFRIYKNYEEMLLAESKMSTEERLDFISIVTPNYLHFEQTKLALTFGFNVILDKPLCMNIFEAIELRNLINESKLLFCLTHTYTGYPMIKEARFLVKSGKIGKVRKVNVEYPQSWLSTKLELSGNKQAEWRNDPLRSGNSCCLGDIGTHAFNLAEYVSCMKITEICADVTTIVEGRILDDDVSILLRFENGAKGVLQSSQVLSGEENSLKICIWGEQCGLEWIQSDSNSLIVKYLDKPNEIYRAGNNLSYLSENARRNCRTPGGHPEGYLEAFANIYRNFALDVMKRNFDKEVFDYPGIEEGVRGMLFIEKSLESSKSDVKWIKMEARVKK